MAERSSPFSPPASLTETGVRLLYRYGWRIGPHLPSALTQALIGWGAQAAVRRGGDHRDHLIANLRGAGVSDVGPAELRDSYASYLRNLLEAFALPGWGSADIAARVITTGEDVLRRAFAERGAVVALPHSGNWDLAGAWACSTGMPVSTVAEQLLGEEFAAFLSFRTRLGMRVLSHRDPAVIGELVADARARRLICLVADRDLVGSGLPVSWHGHPVRMPAGPALIARRSGAALIPAVCRYTPRGMLIAFGPEVAARPGRDGLTAMTQQVADFFADRIAEAPQDWHLMQPFFDPGAELDVEPDAGEQR